MPARRQTQAHLQVTNGSQPPLPVSHAVATLHPVKPVPRVPGGQAVQLNPPTVFTQMVSVSQA